MILILPGELRSEFLYSRLLSACCGEGSAGPMVGQEKPGSLKKKQRDFGKKTGGNQNIAVR